MPKPTKRDTAAFVRNFIFGVEDSLVSTVGLVSGIAAGGVPRPTILLSGMVLIAVEALSMGVGSILSETSAQEFIYKRDGHAKASAIGGVIMFISYFFAGFVPLAPYLVLDISDAFPLSIAASLIALFVLGYVGARAFNAPVFKNALRMLLLGGLAIVAGMAIGFFLK